MKQYFLLGILCGLFSSLYSFGVFGSSGAKSSTAKLTAELLYQGLKVPLEREYPLSSKISPCENFHAYVCSEVEESFSLPKDRSRWIFSFADNAEKILKAKTNYLKWLQEGGKPQSAQARPLRNFYKACMDTKASASAEKRIIQTLSTEIDKIQSPENLASWLVQNVIKGYPSPLVFETGDDQTLLDQHDVRLSTALFSLPEKSYYEKAEALKDLQDLAKDFFTLLLIPDPEQKAKALVAFERKAVLAYPAPSELRGLYNTDTYVPREFWKANYPRLSIENLFQNVPSKIRTRNMYSKSFEFLNSSLQDKNTWEELKFILKFQLLSKYTKDAYPTFFAKRWKFLNLYFGAAVEPPPRDEYCTKMTMGFFDRELDFELIHILFPNLLRSDVEDIVKQVRSSLRTQITKNSWLSEPTRREAIKKIDSAKLSLVSPAKLKDWDFNLPVKTVPNDPVYNVLEVQKSLYKKDIKKLSEKRDPEVWGMSPLATNAYYNGSSNRFVLLQGVLQHPLYSNKLSRIQKLGAIGMIVGHELGHGIDDEGSKYDSEGMLRKWLQGKDLDTFNFKASVLKARLDNINHNGALKLGEAIGDHVGLFASFEAAFANMKSKAQDAAAQAKNEKDFFISYARIWCGVATPQFEEMAIKTLPHPLGRVRINEQVIHHEAFHRAFSCKPGDKMYLKPEERAAIWSNPIPQGGS